MAGSFFSNKLVAYILVIEKHFVKLVFPFGQFIFLELLYNVWSSDTILNYIVILL